MCTQVTISLLLIYWGPPAFSTQKRSTSWNPCSLLLRLELHLVVVLKLSSHLHTSKGASSCSSGGALMPHAMHSSYHQGARPASTIRHHAHTHAHAQPHAHTHLINGCIQLCNLVH